MPTANPFNGPIPPAQLKEICLELVEGRLLYWLQSKIAPLVLAQPPFGAEHGIAVGEISKEPLRRGVRTADKLIGKSWPHAGLYSFSCPVICVVMEGQADFVVAQKSIEPDNQLDRTGTSANRKLSQWFPVTLQLPERTILVIPTAVPRPDGTRPHWERPLTANAHSQLLWMTFLPTGVLLHLCQTKGRQHGKSWSLFVSDSRLETLVTILLEELEENSELGRQSAAALLTSILLRLEVRLRANRITADTDEINRLVLATPATMGETGATMQPIERALDYIEEHLNEPLSVERIASHAYLSPSSLNRIFRERQSTSVMNYVTQRRIARACSLLSTTPISIQHVGQHVGYHDPAHFSSVFSHHMKVSPTEYRRVQYDLAKKPKRKRKS
jgi:AraC-like DNA-binding protein